ncbi:MAG: DUF763 domain-containing protein [Endomicrobiales bacterium]|nr:DUF763 domain-containing protein [Endomicrobiales bacterium]
MKTGIADLPLHGGKAPRWLFSRMTRLSREIIKAVVWNFGPDELIARLSDPFWFQAFGCILGFDWHSSGLTTTVCGAMKQGMRGIEKDLGIFFTGGKGSVSRQTPNEITLKSESVSINPSPLIYASRLSAKVDSAAVQDGYQLYQHMFIFTLKGKWSVIQQGMNEANKYARRYHWLGEKVDSFVVEPHSAICCDKKENDVLNMVSKESEDSRNLSTEISKLKPDKLYSEFYHINQPRFPSHHEVLMKDINSSHIKKIFLTTYEKQPEDFEKLLGIEGVGPKTVRALALLADLLYGKKPSYADPVRFSFAHGGKDGHPYPVNRKVYENTINFMEKALSSAKLGQNEKFNSLKKLEKMFGGGSFI